MLFSRFMGLCLGVVLILMGCSTQALSLKKNYPVNYTVQNKDTLWAISAKYLNDPWHWPSLWACNPQIHNPHLIYPGDKLHMAIVNGQPCLQREPRVVKLSPTVRVDSHASPIAPIPLDLIEPFLTKTRVMSKKQFLTAPYVLAQQEERLMSTRGDVIYVRGIKNQRDKRFLVLHREETYFDPQTKKPLGIEARYVASAQLQRLADPAELKVTQVRGVIGEGDRLFADKPGVFPAEFVPHTPKNPVNAQIIAILRNISQVGRFNVVALNYGKTQGAKPGQVLAVMKAGRILKDKYAQQGNKQIKLPTKQIGTVMIFRTFPKVSYALVMKAQQAIRVLNKVQRIK
jgi:hypothetical protein